MPVHNNLTQQDARLLNMMHKQELTDKGKAIAEGKPIDMEKALALQGTIVSYEGEKDAVGRPTGQGKATFQTGATYEGSWAQGLRHGQGKEVRSGGDVFVGTYEFGIRHGKGQLTQKDGDIYTGTWLKGKLDGVAVYQNAEKLGPGVSTIVLLKHGVRVQSGDKTVYGTTYIVSCCQFFYMIWIAIGLPTTIAFTLAQY